MLILVSYSPVAHQTARSEEPFLAQAWRKQPAAPWHSVGAQQVQHRASLSEVFAISCPLGKSTGRSLISTAFWWSFDGRHKFIEYYSEHRGKAASEFSINIFIFSAGN